MRGAVAFGLLMTFALAPRTSRADSPFDGKWRQGALREDYTVQQWLPGCGPPPVSNSQGGGEVVTVHQDGDELTFSGGGRTYKTNQCYDQLPTLSRDAHSREASGRAWRTRCTTPPADPRRATMNTLVAATSDSHIDVVETGRYEIALAEGRCIADVKRTRSYDLVARDGAPAATAAPPPQPAPTQPAPPAPPPKTCASPGPPARLEVRPSRKLLRTGESFTFHAVVTDASGCNTSTATTWALAPGSATSVAVDPSGKVTVPSDATEGAVQIVATAAGKSARVTVDVSSPAHYDDLLAKEGLNAAGESEAASVAELATGTIGGAEARAEDGAKRRRVVFIAVVGLLAAILGGVALVFSRKAKRAAQLEKEAEERHEEAVRAAEERRREKKAAHEAAQRAHEESVKRAQEAARDAARRETERRAAEAAAAAAAKRMVCPICRREFTDASAFCPHDGAQLVAPQNDQPLPAGSICPACKRGFEAGAKVCPFDHEELVPYAMHAAVSKAGSGTLAIAQRGKICPTCGGRFDGNATFCGKDGTALVLIN